MISIPLTAIYMNHHHVVSTGGTDKTDRFEDIEITPVVIGRGPMIASWYHRGVKIFSDARTIYTEYMATIPAARYGVYQLEVISDAGTSMYDVLYTPNVHEGKKISLGILSNCQYYSLFSM